MPSRVESAAPQLIIKSFNAQAVVAATGIAIWTPATGRRIRVLGYSFSATVAASISLCDAVVATKVFRGPIVAAAGIDSQPNLNILMAAITTPLIIDVSAGSTLTGSVWGVEEAA